MKKILLLAFVSLLTGSVIAGNNDREKMEKRAVTGKVTDLSGEPIAGAVLTITETGEAFFTDLDGNYKISYSAKQDLNLTIQTIGFAPLQVPLSKLPSFSDLQLKSL